VAWLDVLALESPFVVRFRCVCKLVATNFINNLRASVSHKCRDDIYIYIYIHIHRFTNLGLKRLFFQHAAKVVPAAVPQKQQPHH
jgi:hypothetical protein